ncbi:MAG: hypothetical protein R3Y62_07475 [Eubacteriales bacterium]
MKKFENIVAEYAQLNSVVQYGGAVVFGSTFSANLHVSELAQNFQTQQFMYNRSVENLSIVDAVKLLEPCVLDLYPEIVFINLGETDLDFDRCTLLELIAQYEWILYQIHAKLKNCSVEIVSVCSEHPNATLFNRALLNMAKQAGCGFVDLEPVLSAKCPEVRAFGILRSFLQNGHLCFGDAMALAME